MNLTDNEIIKALECCLSPDVISCKDIKCPFKKRCEKDGDALEKACLDLIKQKQEVNLLAAKEIVDLKIKIADQKAEIEKLTINMNAFGLCAKNLKEDNDQLKEDIEVLESIVDEQYHEIEYLEIAQDAIKHSAIKEFWKKIKKYCKREIIFVSPDDERELIKFGNNLVKEMVESVGRKNEN